MIIDAQLSKPLIIVYCGDPVRESLPDPPFDLLPAKSPILWKHSYTRR